MRANPVQAVWDRRSPRRARVRRMHSSRVRSWIVGAAAIVVLTACGTPTEGSPDIAVLADRAERLAEHLEAGEGCLAEREGADLVARARDAVAAERIPPGVGDEVRDVVAEVTAAVPCENGDDAPTEEEREAAEETAEEAPEEGADEGREEAPAAEREEAPEEAPEEGPEEGAEEGNSGNGNSEDGPPGRSEDGPPGQRSSGRGRG